MNDTENKVSEQETARGPDHTPAPTDRSQVLSPRRRSALVTYLAILFAVAFLFVALMMVVEAKRLKAMNQQTSASLTNNINALQAENQKLSGSNKELSARIAALEAEAETAAKEKEDLQARLDQLTENLAAKEAECGALQTQMEELNQRALDAIEVSELLHKAIDADERGSMSELTELLEQIEPLQDLLSPTEAEIYEELKIA